ncbi:MAG: chemotaxis response regulator protein-glutamate methylesterase [Spirochaetaceae bacterium]|nr:chemotaxis response regulator protein-glutamate methylesterase [Myxococcales bacterium]MCB9726396.1 chemotaxis response regulator protein-glutamate methylesterase [Spirochaetaceae bacterium]HPG24684.1 chemotaxis response regulator protein-glutamate methylesterase [Myxococcota bacterium]
MGRPVRVLVVDDSAFVRKRLSIGLEADPDIEVVGAAEDAFVAKRMLDELEVDVMTLDVEMPGLNGLDFLRRLMGVRPLPVVMVSSLTQEGAGATLACLAAGAVDFVAKPSGPGEAEGEFLTTLRSKIHTAAAANLAAVRHGIASGGGARLVAPISSDRMTLCIGASTGGPEALAQVLERMPADAPATLIVQHMPGRYTPRLAQQLDRICAMEVREARTGDRLERGRVLLAPGGYQMRLLAGSDGVSICCTDEEKVNGHSPSVDVLFTSAARVLGPNCVAVVMTGMGEDGARGLAALRAAGARTFAQDRETSVVFGMPKAAQAAGGAERLVPLGKIAETLIGMADPAEAKGG